LLQRLAFQTLHQNEGLALILSEVVDGANVGMVKGGGGAGFAVEIPQGFAVMRHFFGQEFDRHGAI
jgi:hypothetical protein